MMGKTTLSDISDYTGLSITTISRVLNGKSKEYRISSTAQQKVMEAVKRLNYRPSLIAQSLRNKTTRIIGLLIPSIDNPFFANIASTVIREAYKYEFPVMVIDTHESEQEEKSAIATLLAHNVAGVIVVPCSDDPDHLVALNMEKPLVLIDRYFENCELSFIATDNFKGAVEATNLLISNGHRNIMCIQGTHRSITSRQRVNGFLEAMTAAGCRDKAIICGNEFSTINGYVEAKLALSTGRRPSAIFALSNTILLGTLKAVREHGLRVPEDISLISFDDNLYLDFLNPPITRISQPTDEISMAAVKILMDRIRDGHDSFVSHLLSPSIILRNSIAGPYDAQ